MSVTTTDTNAYNNIFQPDSESSVGFYKKVQSVKNFLNSMNLSISNIKYNQIFKNDQKVVMSFINVYLRCKLINTLFFALFLFFASAAFVYSISHIRYDKKNISGKIGHIMAETAFTLSLSFIIMLGVINFHRFGLFHLNYYKIFLISFFMYTISILFFRKYNQMVDNDENVFFQLLFFYTFLGLVIVSLLGMFISFALFFRSFSEVKLCNFSDNSKLSIWYFIMFAFCMFVTANLVMTYF